MVKRDTHKTSSVQTKHETKAVAKQPPKAAVAAKKAVPAGGRASPRAASSAPKKKATSRKPSFSKHDLKQFQLELLSMRDRIADQSSVMKTAALQRSEETNVEEDGTDSFLRLQHLGQVGTQQSIITKINEALDAINKGTYGICDICGALINKERIAVLPFARNCITCQSEMEQRSNHHARLFR
ncbi:MAG: TraR/DksA C4-type zinc finger protein [Kiritimatiellaeota bacterium]|nr:TraR/DksA C4-type zinc finger protein [Kiritimatiellota bacterium]